MGEGQIAGILQRLKGGLRTVAGVPPAVQGDVATLHEHLGTAAVEAVVYRGGSLFNGGGHGDGLKGGSGLIAVGDHPVAPLGKPCRHQRLLIGIDRLVIGFAALLQGGVGALQPVQLLLYRRVADLQVVVGVVAAQGGHGQHFSGFHVHNEAKGAVLHVIFFNGGLHIFLQIVLQGGVQRQHHAVAIGSLVVFFKRIGHLRLIVALGGDDLSGGSLQGVVVVGFNALRTHVAGVGKADDLGRQAGIGIGPLGIRLHVDANDAVFHNEVPDFGGHFVWLLGGQHFVAHGDIRRLLPDPGRVQALGHQVQIHFVIVKLLGIQKYVFHAGGYRHDIHVPVINIAPGGGDGGGTGLIVQRFFRIFVVAEDHQIGEHPHHRQKCDNAAQD